MAKTRIRDALTQKHPLVSDGAWGTFLQAKGLEAGQCPELWNVEHREDVLDAARCYVAAGADLIETNSFGGSRFKLAHCGLAERAAELNEAAAAISREAAADTAIVLGSVGPTGRILMMGDTTEDELFEAFTEQVVALERGGADAICVETMSALDEALLAVRAAREHTSLEIVCTFTFERTVDGTYRTMMGVGPTEMAGATVQAGATIIGTNCGNGMERMVDIVTELHEASPEVPLLVHANAGSPRVVDGATVFPETPEEMASRVGSVIAAGASIVGGCCGTTPRHIAAMVESAEALRG